MNTDKTRLPSGPRAVLSSQQLRYSMARKTAHRHPFAARIGRHQSLLPQKGSHSLAVDLAQTRFRGWPTFPGRISSGQIGAVCLRIGADRNEDLTVKLAGFLFSMLID